MSNHRKDGIEQLAGMFKALSNPNRLQIFVRSMAVCAPGVRCRADGERMRCCVGETAGGLGLAPSTVSHHIKELRQAGLVRVERNGRSVDCWIDDQALRALLSFLEQSSSALEERYATG